MKLGALTILVSIIMTGSLFAQDLEPIELNTPDTERGEAIMQALAQRRSVRQWSDRELSDQDISDLLWAANGVNRPEEGKRTAPTAFNVQDIDLYIFTEDGVYHYDAFANVLDPVLRGDIRSEAGIQGFVGTAPVTVLIVSDMSRYSRGNEAEHAQYAAMHAGIVSQNISLFCSGNGMGTVVIGMLDAEALHRRLNLKDSQVVLLSHPVGYID
ncbi:SagB/ThcOx family dehydrogenase [Chitinispirillales bacterium ANBcel5]|uniref:SagB/ThcOx family dehydrogenase n=1 Tax=Cellulosispirillum alkaliphilum TaxID=3039283 RepID=UPI002A5861CE|nr:SagB/ThcOx family dehydrogenase [Chitinispirillales bacterium ANBcel5]